MKRKLQQTANCQIRIGTSVPSRKCFGSGPVTKMPCVPEYRSALICIAENDTDVAVMSVLDDEIVRAVAVALELKDMALDRELARLIGFCPELVGSPDVTVYLRQVQVGGDDVGRMNATTSLSRLWRPYAKWLVEGAEGAV